MTFLEFFNLDSANLVLSCFKFLIFNLISFHLSFFHLVIASRMRTSIWAELEVTLDVVLDDSADVGEDVRGIRIGAKSGVMVTR